MHVLIVGAGTGGLTLAQNLRKRGISYEIFERDVDSNSRFQGWAIALHTIRAKNENRILDDLVSSLPSDLPDVREATNHLAPLTLPGQFRYYYGGKDQGYGFEDCAELPFIRAERSLLRKWLLTNLNVQWNKHAIRIEHDDAGVQVFFNDGTSAKGDIVVGADGVYSPVRTTLLQRPSSELLQVVPLSAIVGELNLSGEAFTRQLALGHSAYNLINPELGFIGFVGLHKVLPDAKSGRFYWMFMQPDAGVNSSQHWLQISSQQEKLDHVLKTTAGLPPKLREIFELTPAEGIRKEPHIWRDLELDSLPSSRIVLLGDAAHAMTPSRGEGAFHAFLDAIKLTKVLAQLEADGSIHDIDAVKAAVAGYHEEVLRRGGAAVRASRSSYQDSKKRAETGEHFITGMIKLSDAPIVLDVKA
ncbi:Monooxygenase FAD-binding [Penicillium cf. griseofulvum]|uniref:Monooxygenase FAD-binding n=1 Tax=Penicillium cf. griseofulvum TaxID=2972120 RepID=A0A9W9J206_9EURO|nr:Monooxygenase FAD-binding [Penicillium cf. griseofulvum]KAJ5434044.1 Monooxygenase FAD-binding [Penicillium cf. griseofulvum]